MEPQDDSTGVRCTNTFARMTNRPQSVTTVRQLNEAIATEAFKRPFPACVGVHDRGRKRQFAKYVR